MRKNVAGMIWLIGGMLWAVLSVVNYFHSSVSIAILEAIVAVIFLVRAMQGFIENER
ncbi:MAG: hypothetical protein MR210_05775 [Erysipelotrichaceae bacterium]|nr:hypothetical protein [Erysipelotrichaceae bacterium]MDY5252619.1 hypothetical protein [Erysipelotrichaceae bacterium]